MAYETTLKSHRANLRRRTCETRHIYRDSYYVFCLSTVNRKVPIMNSYWLVNLDSRRVALGVILSGVWRSILKDMHGQEELPPAVIHFVFFFFLFF